jgi:putative FmdB family regulatory protein
MPIYEYHCASCGFQKEFLQKLSDPLRTVCPECGKESFKKMLTAAGFHLKGSGWYATDFKHSGTKPQPKPDGVKTGSTKAGDAKKVGAKTDGAKTDGAKTDSAKTDSAKTDSGAKSGSGSDSKSSQSPAHSGSGGAGS